MRLMEKAELGGLDSTSTTIAKWDALFKKALPNLGYRDSLIENMYPYDKGIPLQNGEYLPVDKTTGRRFFQLSWADKLAGVLSKITSRHSYTEPGHVLTHGMLHFGYVLEIVCLGYETAQKIFPDITEKEYTELITTYKEALLEHTGIRELVRFFDSDLCKRYWKKYLDGSDVYATALGGNVAGGFNSRLNETEMRWLKDHYTVKWMGRTNTNANWNYQAVGNIALLVFNKNLDNIFDKFPSHIFTPGSSAFTGYIPGSAYSNIKAFSEVYFQDYLVISLNPIDKFMLSTKQAFSSCMSIAKQDDTRGTASGPAFGLPALFPTDSVFLVFLTPGKHKNMYWEEDEWMKSPDNRDKEKAYKYLKMTCRALTYKCKFGYTQEAILKSYKRQSRTLAEVIDKLGVDNERLLIGRQYAAKGEDYGWEWFIEFALSRAGIATGAGLGDIFDELRYKFRTETDMENISTSDYVRELIETGVKQPIQVTVDVRYLSDMEFLRKGRLCDGKCVVTDKYGYIRGIYYDNVSIKYLDSVREKTNRGIYQYDEEYPCHGEGILPSVKAGSTREGSYGITRYSPKPGLDMFKMMMGKQNYSYLQMNIKICSKCGEILKGSEASRKLPNSGYICDKCCERLEIKECPVCHQLYTKDEANEHVIVNFRTVTNPKNWQDFPEQPVCYTQLKKAEWKEDYSDRSQVTTFCAHCGNTSTRTYFRSSPPVLGKHSIQVPGKGELTIAMALCDKCVSKAVMCEKCKKVIFLDSTADACLLLPNRRVVCPDCIDSIRMRQEKRNVLKALLADMTEADFKTEPADNPDLVSKIARMLEEKGIRVGRPDTVIKDVVKQIQSFKQAHPEVANPTLKSSNSPLPSELDDDLEVALPF